MMYSWFVYVKNILKYGYRQQVVVRAKTDVYSHDQYAYWAETL